MKHIYICSHEAHTFVLFPYHSVCFLYFYVCFHGFPGVSVVKNPPASAILCLWVKSSVFSPWVRQIPWRRKWQPTPAFLPGESQGQRSLAASRPWGHRVRHNLATDHTVSTGSNWPHADGIIIKNDGMYEHLINFYRFICYHLLLFHCKQF